jgi:lysophospholipase L1-like esterase
MRILPRIRVLGLVLLSLTVFSVPFAAFGQDDKAPVAKLDLKDGDTVVFLGDSITHQCLYTQYVEDYFYTRFPKLNVRFHNAGVGGAKARDALDRFDRDVAAYKPKYVTILLGMNGGTYKPYDDAVFQTYKADMTELLGKIRGIGATPILMTPTMYDSRAMRMRPGVKLDAPGMEGRLELYNATLAYYGAWLREVAVESGAGFVDMYSPLNNLTLQARKDDPKFTMIKDAVHPDAPGQLVMGFAILEDMGFPRPVSNIRVTVDSGKEPKVAGQGGKATNVQATGGGVEFTWAAESLPWVLPSDTAVGAKLLRSGHRMSREALEVHGLPPGK